MTTLFTWRGRLARVSFFGSQRRGRDARATSNSVHVSKLSAGEQRLAHAGPGVELGFLVFAILGTLRRFLFRLKLADVVERPLPLGVVRNSAEGKRIGSINSGRVGRAL